MLVRFWGVRGSYPIHRADSYQVGGHTSCVSVESQGQLFIFDAGTGLGDLGKWLQATNAYSAAHLFISHGHLDHLGGLLGFGPLWSPDFSLTLLSDSLQPYGGIQAVIDQLFRPPFSVCPWSDLPSSLTFKDMGGVSWTNNQGFSVVSLALDHPGGAAGYRLSHPSWAHQGVAYVTDTNHTLGKVNQDLMTFIRQVGLLIYDSTFTDSQWEACPTWGHSTWRQAVTLAQAAGVKNLGLFHHNPEHTDETLKWIEQEAKKIFPQAFLTLQGMIKTIP